MNRRDACGKGNPHLKRGPGLTRKESAYEKWKKSAKSRGGGGRSRIGGTAGVLQGRTRQEKERRSNNFDIRGREGHQKVVGSRVGHAERMTTGLFLIKGDRYDVGYGGEKKLSG